MNLVFAKTFLEVVKVKNLNKAAAILNVTESTVTTRINSLENLLGKKLLLRSRGGAELTSEGFKFVRYAELLVQAWEQAQQELALPEGFDSLCNVGCHTDLWESVGEEFTDLQKHLFPKTALSIWSGNETDLVRWLNSGMIDLAFSFERPDNPSYSCRELFEDEIVYVSSHKQEFVEWDGGYIYVDHGPAFRRQHAEAFSISKTPALTIGNSAWALTQILKQGGSGYLPARMVEDWIEKEKLFLPKDAPRFNRPVYLVFKSARLNAFDWFESLVERIMTNKPMRPLS